MCQQGGAYAFLLRSFQESGTCPAGSVGQPVLQGAKLAAMNARMLLIMVVSSTGGPWPGWYGDKIRRYALTKGIYCVQISSYAVPKPRQGSCPKTPNLPHTPVTFQHVAPHQPSYISATPKKRQGLHAGGYKGSSQCVLVGRQIHWDVFQPHQKVLGESFNPCLSS